MQDVPEGFAPLVPGGPYLASAGPIYQRPGAHDSVVMALRIGPQHTNVGGIAHGGFLATLADSAMGRNVARLHRSVTVSMTTDFISPAQVGDWLEAHVRVRKQGRRLAFAECDLKVGDRLVLRASGVFSAVDAAGPRSDGG